MLGTKQFCHIIVNSIAQETKRFFHLQKIAMTSSPRRHIENRYTFKSRLFQNVRVTNFLEYFSWISKYMVKYVREYRNNVTSGIVNWYVDAERQFYTISFVL